ncbi:hypothetical protein CGE22_004793 [Escherichia coli]|nr:hypothetical protein [Escherichia coli]EEY1015865.1 hypothetical protein [Escherichia coli]EFE5230610.1 hypothetical protein [Escherichia coli]
MRDIRQVLERWGAWAANNHEDVTWSPIAAGFKGLIPEKVKSRPQCCDDDAMIICGCMARLNRNNCRFNLSMQHPFQLSLSVF